MCLYSCLSNNEKSRTGPYNSLRHTDNRKNFSGLSNAKLKESAHALLGEGSWKNLEMFLLRKR